MPQEVVHHITQIGHAQGMPSRITYTNQQGDEISDCLEDFFDDNDAASTDSDDDTYVTSHSHSDTNDDALSVSVSDDETMSTSNDNDDDPHDDHDMPAPEIPDPPDHTAPLPPGDKEDVLEDDDSKPPPANDNGEHIPIPDAVEGQPAVTDECESDDSSETTSLEPPPIEHDHFKATKEASGAAGDYKLASNGFPCEKRPPPMTRLSNTSLLTSWATMDTTTVSSQNKCLPREDCNSLDKKELTH